jgi:tRNA(Ile)-lysidine synthase
VPFYTERFETEKFAATEKISIQMAARELRYAWFGQLLKTEGYSYLAVAHHLDDVLETIVLNLVKGTGIAGLRGIRAKNDKIIRPLLFSGKEQIRAYAGENQLPWTEDSSNSSEKYQRNLLRHQVVPVLQQINPNLLKAIESTAERVEAVETIFYAQVKQIQEEACFVRERDFYIEVEKLVKNPGLSVILDKLLEPFGFNYIQADTIAQKIAAGIVPEIIGKTFYSHTHRLDIDREHLIVSPLHRKPFGNLDIHADTESIEASGFSLTFERKDGSAFDLKADKSRAALDFHALDFPLTLRKWEPGDWFMPLGMPHKKKLSDFMIDRKIPLNLKDKVYVLTSGGQIVWVVGHRIDERFKITPDTQTIYLVRVQNKND